jgi:uncharacterized membrane protein
VADRRVIEASERGHHSIQVVLRLGLAVGAALMAIGLIVDLAEGDRTLVAVPLRSILGTGSIGDRLMAVGILALLLTPVARVMVLVGVWWKEGDRRFAAVGLVVLAVLITGIVAGLG